jgi:hypothetical protein
MSIGRIGGRGALVALLVAYTAFALGPVLWLASMSLRTTAEIDRDHYALPRTFHWGKFAAAWVESNYRVYFWNSAVVVTTAAAAVVAIGGMAGYCLARYRFRGNRAIFFAIFSTIMLPPQITVISFFQILVQYQGLSPQGATRAALDLYLRGRRPPVPGHLAPRPAVAAPAGVPEARAPADPSSRGHPELLRGATIGANATVVCGHTIGRYAFIGAGAVVTQDVPDHAQALGVPARVVGWMCRCGVRLVFAGPSATCTECGGEYREDGGHVTPVE